MENQREAEKIFSRSKSALIVQLIGAAILIPFFGIGLILGIASLIQYTTHKLVIKRKSITYRRGLIGSYTKEIPFSKVNGVNVDQGVGGKIFGYGSVKIVTGNDIDTIKFDLLEQPEQVKKLIQKLVEQNDPNHARRRENYSEQQGTSPRSEAKITRLEKLANLKKQGILTDAEFQAEKKKILSEVI